MQNSMLGLRLTLHKVIQKIIVHILRATSRFSRVMLLLVVLRPYRSQSLIESAEQEQNVSPSNS